MTKLRVALVVLLTFLPRVASAIPFTVDFVVTWDTVSDPAILGTGAVIGFTVDNRSLSPLNQTYMLFDAQLASVDATAFGGTYNHAFGFSQINSTWPPVCGGSCPVLFTVSESGQAVMDFANFPNGANFDGFPVDPVNGSQFIYWETLNIYLDRVLFSERRTVTDNIFPGSGARGTVPNGLWVGSVRSVPDSTHTLSYLGLALAGLVISRQCYGYYLSGAKTIRATEQRCGETFRSVSRLLPAIDHVSAGD